jgi:mannose/fructose/N-acetylgalactosamine-specific phosphotransferase system component IIC
VQIAFYFFGDVPYLIIGPLFSSSYTATLWSTVVVYHLLNVAVVGYYALRVVSDLREKQVYYVVSGVSMGLTILTALFLSRGFAIFIGMLPSLALLIYLVNQKNSFSKY